MLSGTDARFTTDVLQGLVRINSINPTLDPRGPGEAEIGAYVADRLARLGLEVFRHEPEPGRISVVGRLAGRGGGRSLMLNAHYDTVGVDGMAEPFSAAIRDGRLFGRGAYDMKGSLAACFGAVEALTRAGERPAGDVLIAAVADEEHSSLGTADLVGRYRVDGAIVTEPTSLKICLAHKGFVWLDVVTHGRAAHGSRPDLGIDANVRMGRVLAGLEQLSTRLAAGRKHALLGAPSLHAALLRGGTGLSTYAAECRLDIERRTIPGESPEQVRSEIEEILERLRAADTTFRADCTLQLARPPFEAHEGSPLVAALAGAALTEMGRQPEFVGETPWMDSALLAEAGVDTVVMGPHGVGAHAAEEWVDLDSVHSLARILLATIRSYCA
jgi:acetylornithine deacetylase